jgi:hypothetical protein
MNKTFIRLRTPNLNWTGIGPCTRTKFLFKFYFLGTLGEHCFGSAWVSMGILIQLFTSLRIQIQIQIQGAKPMRIHEDQEPDPGQALLSQKFGFLNEIYTLC